MSQPKRTLSRRDFLKLAGLGLGAAALLPKTNGLARASAVTSLPEFPAGDFLGRNCAADTNLSGGKIELKARPDVNSQTLRDVYRDEVFTWIREVSAESISYDVPSQRWVETPEGYLRGRYIQPCRNLPNPPLTALPAGQPGFWAEVSVPYVDLQMDNAAPVSGWMRDLTAYQLQPRFYYKQVMWVDQVRTLEGGQVQYRLNERYGNPGDLFWADAAGFRPLSEEDIAPISPEVDPALKRIVVNLMYQTLSCYEDQREVYFCRVSTGAGQGSTPIGEHAIWRKMVSTRMANTSEESSYDLPGIPWTTLFLGTGVAIHGTTAHNDFGFPRSHGCVNCRPEDAQWIFRWCQPGVNLEPGDVQWSDWRTGSTHVFVEDGSY